MLAQMRRFGEIEVAEGLCVQIFAKNQKHPFMIRASDLLSCSCRYCSFWSGSRTFESYSQILAALFKHNSMHIAEGDRLLQWTYQRFAHKGRGFVLSSFCLRQVVMATPIC